MYNGMAFNHLPIYNHLIKKTAIKTITNKLVYLQGCFQYRFNTETQNNFPYQLKTIFTRNNYDIPKDVDDNTITRFFLYKHCHIENELVKMCEFINFENTEKLSIKEFMERYIRYHDNGKHIIKYKIKVNGIIITK